MVLAGVLATAHSSDFSLLSPSAVHYPTTSFNAFLSHPNTPPPFCHLVGKICKSLHSHSCPAFMEHTLASIAKILTHPTNSPNPHLLLSLHSSFTPNLGLKHCPSTNPAYPDSSPSYLPPRFNSKRHPPQTICLTLWIMIPCLLIK